MDALRHKVASLEDDLKSSTTANSQLQQQLSEVKGSLSSSTRQLTEERNNLQLQVRMSSSWMSVYNMHVGVKLDSSVFHMLNFSWSNSKSPSLNWRQLMTA